jgi:hypothetical protein
MTTASLNVWYVPGTVDSRIIDSHRRCLGKLGIDTVKESSLIVDDSESIHWNHGAWMDKVLRESKNDVEVFIDIDVLIFNKEILYQIIRNAKDYSSISGAAHCVGHTRFHHDIFVGSPLIAIDTAIARHLGSCVATDEYDTCQSINVLLRNLRVPICAYYPIGFDFNPIGMFGNYGMIGRGIHYPGFYHLLAGGNAGPGDLRIDKEEAIQRFELLSKEYQPPKYGIQPLIPNSND